MAVETTDKLVKLSQAQDIANGVIAKVKAKGYAVAADLGALATKDEVAKADLATALASEIDAKALASDLQTTDGKVTTLIGSDTDKSVRTIANEELAAQLIPQDAQEALDTLQEIAAWIQSHPAEAAAINAKLTLGTHDVDGQQVQYATVKAYVEAYVASQISDAELTGSNAIDISNNTVSLIVDTANANGFNIGINGVGIALATTTTAGAMSAADKVKLDGADVTAYTGDGTVTVTNHVIGIVPASTTAAGTMSAADKTKLDGFELATAQEVTQLIADLDSLD